MKAVNLLPERVRPRGPSGGRGGSAYIVLGALGALLVGVLVYVLTLNSINSTKGQINTAQQQAARDKALADELGAYGDFDKVKTQRVNAVKSLAGNRFDFERLMRELARVLPAGVWLTDANVGASGLTQGGSSTPAPSSSSKASGSSAAGSPALELKGCSTSQAGVAVLLVRARELQGASDATLAQSSLQQTGSGGSSGSASSGTCSSGTYSFTVDVTFQPVSPAPAPPDLGGGS